jgi:hypothetical protein
VKPDVCFVSPSQCLPGESLEDWQCIYETDIWIKSYEQEFYLENDFQDMYNNMSYGYDPPSGL